MLATVAALGSGLAWRNLAKSSELQLRLVRASEMNTHLKEMNLAAAGLAHETRNPLNIIRGLAQMISKQPNTVPEIQKKSREIIEEADKVAAQLNEFINYSRPREVRRSRLALGSVVNEVVRALNYDLEEKKISLQIKGRAAQHRSRRAIAPAGALQSTAQCHPGRGWQRRNPGGRRKAQCHRSHARSPRQRPGGPPGTPH